mmetsp:Transcript_37364/g.98845  ORF Transcript_37364/g.98845 Transcript_37364/m.98845 type:complete len:345 (+) Transcript_37364:1-1035(+)
MKTGEVGTQNNSCTLTQSHTRHTGPRQQSAPPWLAVVCRHLPWHCRRRFKRRMEPNTRTIAGHRGVNTACASARYEPRRSLLLDLGREIEADVAELLDAVLDDERHVLGQRKHDGARERRSLGEEVEVAQGKVEGDRLLERDLHLLILLGVHAAARPDRHVAAAQLAYHRELDAVLADSNGDRVAEDRQVLADALELARRHLDDRLVVRIRNAKVLGVNVHQLELEVRNAVLRLVLEHEGHGVRLVVGLERDDIVIVAALEHLAHGGQVDTERDVAVAAVVVEAIGTQEQRNERHMARVHGLQRDASRRAVEVGLSDEVLHGLGDLLEHTALSHASLKHIESGK